jgi:uncharacterized membrane protein
LRRAWQKLKITACKYPEILLPCVFVLVACFVSVHLLYNSYTSSAFDLGIFTEVLKNTLNGMPLYSGIEGFNHLAIHFSPILFLLVPFYWLVPDPQMLLVIQAISLGVGGYLVYYIAKYYKLSSNICLLMEVLYFINPLIWGMITFDFHEVCFAPPLLLIMMIGMIQKRWILFTVGLVLSLTIKEDIVVTIGALGVSLFLFDYLKTRKINKISIVMIVSAVLTVGLAIFVSDKLSDGHSPHILDFINLRYSNADTGVSILNRMGNFVNYRSFLLALAYLAPLSFLPMLSIKWTIPALVILAISMASMWGGQHNMINQYPAGAIAYLFLATIITLSKGIKMRNTMIMICVIASVILITSPLGRINLAAFPTAQDLAIDKVISNIPNGASVTANNIVFPHLVSRTNACLPKFYTEGVANSSETSELGFPYRDTEYVVITEVLHQNEWEDDIKDELNKKYILIVAIDGTELYKLK